MGREFQSEFAQSDLPFDSETEQVWTRRSKEPSKAWSAFVVYRDMLPSKRGLTAAFRLWYGQNYPGESVPASPPPNWSEWKRRWQWDERTEAFDRVNQADAEKVARLRHREFLNQTREQFYVIAESKLRALEVMRALILRLLEAPLGRLRQTNPGENGAMVERVVDTLAQFVALSAEARESEKDLFEEALASVRLTPDDLTAGTTVEVRNAIFEWVHDLKTNPPPASTVAILEEPDTSSE
ncbi:MAG: hypothetical protein U0R19_33830 [Bryobacteraceae bacterium]